jgi:hypothetical protein
MFSEVLMTLRDLKIEVLDIIDEIINSPFVNPEEVKTHVEEAFEEASRETPAPTAR